MEDVLGDRTDSFQFQAFLNNWEAVLAHRVEEALTAFCRVDGLHALVLAGSVGRGDPWPLSDLDLIPIYADDALVSAPFEIDRRRQILLERWVTEGWWTGLDIGRLRFARSEVERALQADETAVLQLLGQDRWYFSVDKGFGGRALHDPDGLATALAAWFTAHRFTPPVVALRLARERQELDGAMRRCDEALYAHDPLMATRHLREAVKWMQTWQLERWGHRDNSQGRLGTRFAVQARALGVSSLVGSLDEICDLDPLSVWRRLAAAPDWVWERHDRSWRARQHVHEPIARLDDARDTLRVCALYAMRSVTGPPYPPWLAIPESDVLATKITNLRHVTQVQLASGNHGAGTHQASPPRPSDCNLP